jgi:hypothetical protein
VLEGFFVWMEGVAIYGGSAYLGPGVNLIHLLGMVLFLGALLIVDLRLLNLGCTETPLSRLSSDAHPWLVGGFLILLITGIPALMSTATLQYGNSIFWFKMYVLLAATIFTFTYRRTAVKNDRLVDEPRAKLIAVASIVMWLSIPASARLIMLLPADILGFFPFG